MREIPVRFDLVGRGWRRGRQPCGQVVRCGQGGGQPVEPVRTPGALASAPFLLTWKRAASIHWVVR